MQNKTENMGSQDKGEGRGNDDGKPVVPKTSPVANLDVTAVRNAIALSEILGLPISKRRGRK